MMSLSPGSRPVALVTAGGRRIGAHIAARLAHAGYALAIHGRSAGAMDNVLVDAIAQTGVPMMAFQADLGDPSAVDGLWREVCAWAGRAPTLLVNNAALFTDDTAATATTESIRLHQAINCDAPVQLTRLLWRDTPEGQQACAVMLLDQRIAQPNGDQFSYSLSKLALSGAMKLLARALAPRVRVNAVAPGLTMATADYTDQQMTRLAAAMPLARLPGPNAIADAVAWLAGAEAVTNQTLFVDGGAHMAAFDRDFVFLHRD